ncbi:MAG: hypothetical protein ACREO6_01055, partial [Rudaea sp.]
MRALLTKRMWRSFWNLVNPAVRVRAYRPIVIALAAKRTRRSASEGGSEKSCSGGVMLASGLADAGLPRI